MEESKLLNSLPNIIPDIVWDDLLESEKIRIIEAVEKKYTDVIEIKKNAHGYSSVSTIYSMATSERGIIKAENPVPDIIPCDIWNNLPDVLKEEIIEGKTGRHRGSYFGYRFTISYDPDKNTINISRGSVLSSRTYIYDAKRGVGIGIDVNGAIILGL
ncbi:MAG: hypothetical protein LBB89_09075 [Treponema sp.]|jgi:hypothetical protein|nr:hypothetical protein [Treponema sp.]